MADPLEPEPQASSSTLSVLLTGVSQKKMHEGPGKAACLTSGAGGLCVQED